MLPVAFDAQIAHNHVQWLVEDIGPRHYRSTQEAEAARGVTARLHEAGWSVQHIGNNPVACRGSGRTLFLAHIDSVRGCPGAVDNAGSVAVLLELARTTQATDLCLGFPVGEEAGLIGSEQIAKGWSKVQATQPSLVVALEFAGHGQPTAVDLTSIWGTEELNWLVSHAPGLDIPYTHRTAGRALPQYRSDHQAFAMQGVPAFLLMGRSDIGVFARYHQPNDTTVQPADLARTAQVLEGLATAEATPRGSPDPALPLFGWVLPGWLTWGIIGAGVVSAARDLGQWRATLGSVWRCLVAAVAGAIGVAVVQAMGMDVSEAERTAAVIMGIPPNGWWSSAPVAVAVGWMSWATVRWRLGGRGSAPLVAGVLTVLCTWIDPLIGLPFAAAALLSRVHPLLAVGPALILLRPDPLRELAFHGLLAPAFWGALWILAWPAFGAHSQKR